MSFPPGTEMFQFPEFASNPYVFRARYLTIEPWSPQHHRTAFAIQCRSDLTKARRWVSPFGNPRIKAYSQLPMAYRSVSRPSSPVHAKAFTRCP